MKALIVYDIGPESDNPFVRLLAQALRQAGCDVVCSAAQFHSDAERYDIVHIQWPEALFGWHSPDRSQLRSVEAIFRRLRERGVGIVYTRHNDAPHRGDGAVGEGYRLVERYADAVVHLGDASRRELLAGEVPQGQMQEVIPHHIYEGVYDLSVSQADARRALGIPAQAFVLLAFGTFRHAEERRLVWGAFRRLSRRGKYLLAPRLFPYTYRSRWRTGLRSLCTRTLYLIARAATALAPCRITSAEWMIPDSELPHYLSAADAVMIQRTHILNSGNVTLGFLFGKVVAGPDCGNVGEVLRATGNPVFDPADPASVDRALAEAARLAEAGHGARNRAYALENLTLARTARRYAALYEKVHERTRK